MPEGDLGSGMAIRYGYLDITEKEYRLYEKDGRYYIGLVGRLSEAGIEISGDACQLLATAMQNEYRQKIRFALQDDHQRYSVDEDTCPEGTYLGNPILEGEIQWADHGIEVRQKGETCFIARRLANRPIWEGGDVLISQEAFDFSGRVKSVCASGRSGTRSGLRRIRMSVTRSGMWISIPNRTEDLSVRR